MNCLLTSFPGIHNFQVSPSINQMTHNHALEILLCMWLLLYTCTITNSTHVLLLTLNNMICAPLVRKFFTYTVNTCMRHYINDIFQQFGVTHQTLHSPTCRPPRPVLMLWRERHRTIPHLPGAMWRSL
jgi:hypothetical protein